MNSNLDRIPSQPRVLRGPKTSRKSEGRHHTSVPRFLVYYSITDPAAQLYPKKSRVQSPSLEPQGPINA